MFLGDNKSESETKNKKHIGWKGWTAIASFSTLVIAIIAVLNFCDKNVTPIKKSIITANVKYRKFELPRSYEEALNEISSSRNISADKDIEALLQKLPKKSRKDAIEAISNYIDLHMPYYLVDTQRNMFKSIVGWWDINIKNNSDTTFYDVVLEIPYSIVVTEVFRNSTGLIEIKDNKDYLKLGDIRPREDVNISAWTSELPSRILNEKFKLTHKNGVGEVHIE